MGMNTSELVISRADWDVLLLQASQHGFARAALGRARLPNSARLLVARVFGPQELGASSAYCRDEGLDLLEVVADCGAERILARLKTLAQQATTPALLTLGPQVGGWRWGRPGQALALGGLRIVGGEATGGRPAIERRLFAGAALAPALPVRLQRQIDALGPHGQGRLAALTVAIVGCGGTGGMVAQQLALAGVGRLLLVDHDRIEESNRNRLVGASPADALRGAPKVWALGRYLRRLAPDVPVTALACSVYDQRHATAIASADLLVGCTDNEGSRLHLNALALQHLLPYVDCGVGIIQHADRLEAGGQVRAVLPGGPCLECYGGIDRWRAAYDLAAPGERALQRQHGYGLAGEAPAPALAPLNAIIAAEAAATVVAVATGLRPVVPYLAYDFLGAQLAPRPDVRRHPGCLACAPGRRYGRGDALPLPRPADDQLPELPFPVAIRDG